jgi:DNA-binding PadR family transcriptional regulator
VNEDLSPCFEQRLLRAFLDIIILHMLSRHVMTAYQIDGIILKKFHCKTSPNVIYSKLSVMERQGWLVCEYSRHGRVYCITNKGKKITESIPHIVQIIQQWAPILLG